MLFRRPLHEVGSWSFRDIDLLEAYMARQPTEGELVEMAVARFTKLYADFKTDPNASKTGLESFLPYREDPWVRDEREADELAWSRSVLQDDKK